MSKNNHRPFKASPWVVVADHARARIFRAPTPRGPLEEVHDLIDSDARHHDAELGGAPSGRLAGGLRGAGARRHTAATDRSIRRQHSSSFATAICNVLESARICGAITQLHIVAEPRLLGELRARMSEPMRRLVASELDSELTGQPAVAIRAALPDQL